MPVSPTITSPVSRRVPAANRGILADPSLTHAVNVARDTQRAGIACHTPIAGISLADWKQKSVDDTLLAAVEYAEETGRVPPGHLPAGPLLVGGHQPTLFHCGVLVKNFALARLARRLDGTALNLIVDSDISAPLHLSVPDGSRDQPATRLVPFTTDTAARPWEDLRPDLSAAFTAFPDRVSDALARWGIDPLLTRIWPSAIAAAEAGRGLAECLSAARIAMQDRMGHGTLELPISRLATRTPFLKFMAMSLLEAERFAESHNRALGTYREANNVRSRTHPAADLCWHDGWLETPFWCWHSGDTHRRRLLTQLTPTSIRLSDGSGFNAQWALDSGDDLDRLATALGDWQQSGLRIRPSALSTTLFARVFLADLFIHGIGGSKYDEATDSLMADFFGISPPPYLTLSGTLHLPLGGPFDVSSMDRSQLTSRRRRMLYNAQEFLDAGQASELVERKTSLIRSQTRDKHDTSESSRQNRRQRFHEFRAVNQELTRHTIGARQALDGELQRLDRQLDANSVLTNREFSFCLFPEELLSSFLDEALSELE